MGGKNRERLHFTLARAITVYIIRWPERCAPVIADHPFLQTHLNTTNSLVFLKLVIRVIFAD